MTGKLIGAMEKAIESNMELIDVFNEVARKYLNEKDVRVASYYLGLAIDVGAAVEVIDNELCKLKEES